MWTGAPWILIAANHIELCRDGLVAEDKQDARRICAAAANASAACFDRAGQTPQLDHFRSAYPF